MTKLEQVFGAPLPDAMRCRCFAWVDLFYVPKGAWKVWIRAVEAIHDSAVDPQKPLLNEWAIPLSFQVARTLGECKNAGGCAQSSVTCWGSCCAQAELPHL